MKRSKTLESNLASTRFSSINPSAENEPQASRFSNPNGKSPGISTTESTIMFRPSAITEVDTNNRNTLRPTVTSQSTNPNIKLVKTPEESLDNDSILSQSQKEE